MTPCTLHVGAPKTGSTSIQNALFFDLQRPGFQYAAGGEPNGTLAFEALFTSSPQNERAFRGHGSPGGSFPAYRRRLGRQFERGVLRAARAGSHLILSAETAWVADEGALRSLEDYLTERGFDVRVSGYLRPWQSWITSLFRFRLCYGRGEFVISRPWDEALFDVRGNTERLRRVFGPDRVTLTTHAPAGFPEGCVVRDFCGALGLAVPEHLRFRSNESLSLPALRLLYAWHRFASVADEASPERSPSFFRLVFRLRRLEGPPLQLREAAVADWLHDRRQQHAWIGSELGLTLNVPQQSPAERGIGSETDLFEFDRETLEWLAARSGRRVISPGSVPAVARAVAKQVDDLRRRRWSPLEAAGPAVREVQKQLIRWRYAS